MGVSTIDDTRSTKVSRKLLFIVIRHASVNENVGCFCEVGTIPGDRFDLGRTNDVAINYVTLSQDCCQ